MFRVLQWLTGVQGHNVAYRGRQAMTFHLTLLEEVVFLIVTKYVHDMYILVFNQCVCSVYAYGYCFPDLMHM